jgi:hypothetical protein
MDEVTLRQLRVGDASIDLRVARQADGGHTVDVLASTGGLQVDFAGD